MSVLAFGQTQMSDEQILEFVKTEYSAGKSQTQIARELLQKGVSPEQLKRLKQKYQSMVEEGGASDDRKPERSERLREPNGMMDPATDNTEEVDSEEKTTKKQKPEKKIFGHDIFNSEKLSFQSNINIPAPSSYLLGPGDEVILDVYGASYLSTTTVVSPDGAINIENFGPIPVAGLTLMQAQEAVRRSIGGSFEGSDIKLSIGQTRTILVNVMGEVKVPGTYTMSAFSTVFNALYLAGGVNEIGTVRNINVSRKGKIISTIDVYDFILNGRLSGNVMLQDDDVIIVGTYENLVSIEGLVKRPMYYEMKRNESLRNLLDYAGGFMGGAFKDKIRIERRSSEGLTVHVVDAKDFSTFHNDDEDVVVVAPITERYKNTVTVTGAVFRPGSYKIDNNINSVSKIIEQAGGLLEQAVTSRAVLLRLKEDRTYTTQTLNLSRILDGSQPDVLLQNEDELIISSYTILATERNMSIAGEVMVPGEFPYSENTTIGDLIIMAGGLNEVASLQKVEVSRRITSDSDNADGNQIAKVYTFDLDQNLDIIGGEQFTLQPYDKVTIHRSPNHKPQKSIYIGGEVLFEGWYTLSSKNDKLSSLIQKAGGLTTKAYANGAKLVRKYTEAEMQDRIALLEIAQNSADSLTAMQSIRKTTYHVGIDLVQAMKNPDGENDITLEVGDSIYIPQQTNVVKVSGEVLSPNTVIYKSNQNASYYINQAGGVTENGRKSKAYILYPNGQVSTLRKGKIVPGCEIVVPAKVKREVNPQTASLWFGGASALASISAVIAAMIRR